MHGQQNIKKNKKEQVYVSKYSRINFTNYPATCASKDRETRLISRVGKVSEFDCV